jgi:hypothetical protein
MTSLENLDPTIRNKVAFIIVDGELVGRPSAIIHLDAEIPRVQER